MNIALPYDIFLMLEEKLGKVEAQKVGKAIEVGLSAIDTRANEVALQKKLELKEELSKELASKADIALVKTELKAEIALVKTELKAEIKLLNVKLNFLIVLMIIALTLMNPVVADIIKSWLK